MAEYGNRYSSTVPVGARTRTAEGIDEGLRSYMLGVYNYMALGVAFAAVVSLAVMNSTEVLSILASPVRWVLLIALLALGWFSPRLILTGSTAMAHAAYWTYAGLWGLLIAPMLYFFMNAGGTDTIFKAFAITAATFAAVSLYGYTTKRDLSAFGTFFMMASIGLLIAIVVNAIFFQLEWFSLITSCLVVLLFSGITAYETQAIKEMYHAGDSRQAQTGKSIFGAFMLFGSFITIFIHMLNILGIMGGED
ncbi:MAG: BAX inhibitor (BI)-1/YccA family protein [Rhizobiales bacterium]|nr:BAX inhibitor (BI)-1/YccA family protein [Hyphomicrobiales bacterium]